jgi:hypothetical protein
LEVAYWLMLIVRDIITKARELAMADCATPDHSPISNRA